MATYNGEKYLSDQIDSVLNQSVQPTMLYIQDDCSTDGTWDIVMQYQAAYPDRITAYRLDSNTGSPKHNFYRLMSKYRDDYVMLCDQDDVWLSDKIEKTLAEMSALEQRYSKDIPLLVHTDLCVTDETLRVISPSFRDAMHANYHRTALRDQVIQNTLTGCTCMYNRALADLITEKVPTYMVMHDWWLMLVASAFGKIVHIDAQTVLYRQHGQNRVGAKDTRTIKYKIKKAMTYRDIVQAIRETYLQAQSFLHYYQDKLTDEQAALLTEYCSIPRQNKLAKWRTIIRLGTFKNGIARNIAYFIFV
jgi:glycosyltransferase involved in cell wall biosynthesis